MKKTTIYGAILTLLCLTTSVQAQVITIGTGTGSWYNSPITRLFEFGASETIYDADDIGTTGSITSIGWNIYSTPTDNPTKNASIYLKMSTQATIATTTSTDDYTLVYTGTIENSALGWQNITLDTPFDYNDDTQNLLVLVVHESGDYTYTPPNYYYTTATNKSSYYYSITNPWNNNRTMNLTANRPNIKLTMSDLSVVDIENNNSLRFYPNPIQDNINFSAKKNIATITIYNNLGQIVTTHKANSTETAINLAQQNTGTYLAEITFEDGNTKKVNLIKE
jgi:hypothetical protein